MPLLRAKEIAYPIRRRRSRLALCDHRLAEEMEKARALVGDLERVVYWGGDARRRARDADGEAGLRALRRLRHRERRRLPHRLHLGHHRRAQGHHALPPRHARDLRQLRAPRAARRSAATASSARRRSPSPSGSAASSCSAAGRRRHDPAREGRADDLLAAIANSAPPICFTAPTAYRAMLAKLARARHVVAAQMRLRRRGPAARPPSTPGSPRPASRSSTASARPRCCTSSSARPRTRSAPGATGRPVPGYEARVVDADGNEAPPGTIGRLAVRGPTGCRYLADKRQRQYVQDGWNITGDTYLMDDDGYFWYQARSDDMIVSAGYNIAGPEVEAALLAHPAVAECGVVGAPDEERGQIVKAYVVLRSGHAAIPPAPSAAGPRQGDDRALQISARDRIRQPIAAHPDRQAAALRASPHGRRARLAQARRPSGKEACPKPRRSATRYQAPNTVLQPPGWPRPKGFANGILARGEMVFVGGMIGQDKDGRFAEGFVAQMKLALENIAAVLAEGGRLAAAHRAADLVRARHRRVSRRPAGARRSLSRGHGPALSGDGGGRGQSPGRAAGAARDRGDRGAAG